MQGRADGAYRDYAGWQQASALGGGSMPTRRIFNLILVTVVLWDLGKGTIRLWERRTWATTKPGSLTHDIADMSSIFVG